MIHRIKEQEDHQILNPMIEILLELEILPNVDYYFVVDIVVVVEYYFVVQFFYQVQK